MQSLDLELTRNQKYKLKMKALGICGSCGKRPIHPKSKSKCLECIRYHKLYKRKWGMCGPWDPTKRRGQVPIEPET